LPEHKTVTFEDLKLIEPLLRAVREEGYLEPTPIQEKGIPHVLAGRDLLGCAQTGTGKTAAFALPILQLLYNTRKHGGHRATRALVLSPTRELAAQIADSFAAYGRHTGLRTTVVYGGVSQVPQVKALRNGVDILVATPGRLLDLMGQNVVKLHGLEILVLDEADRMLDMGFIPDVRRIVGELPVKRQTLFFSATLTDDIKHLAGGMVKDPVRVEAAPAATTVEATEQRIYMVQQSQKCGLLAHLLKNPEVVRALVFTRTKRRADQVARHLDQEGVSVTVIHGDKSQLNRQRALDHFKSGRVRVLVATDIAARGLDVENVSHVFNYDLSAEPEAYVHRIGRTGRAEASGIAISFCSPEERELMAAIRRLIHVDPELVSDDTFAPAMKTPPPRPKVPVSLRLSRRSHIKRFRRRR
jgi:ATP-dependent RNA helicase RhlE